MTNNIKNMTAKEALRHTFRFSLNKPLEPWQEVLITDAMKAYAEQERKKAFEAAREEHIRVCKPSVPVYEQYLDYSTKNPLQ